jgi:predicted enzyme related to lactoylglutathione lyase
MTAATEFGLRGIRQIAVNAKNLERAIRFYRDILGMRFLFEAPPQMAFFDCGGVRLLVGLPDRPEIDHPASIIYYSVPDIQAAHQVLQERGVAFITAPHLVARMPDHELWLADFRDSEDNILALLSEVRSATQG